MTNLPLIGQRKLTEEEIQVILTLEKKHIESDVTFTLREQELYLEEVLKSLKTWTIKEYNLYLSRSN